MKLAVVVSGWHFPLHFYKKIKEQKIPTGWEVEYFCVSHRDPSFSLSEKKDFLSKLGNSRREKYDKILYEKIATENDIKNLGWSYKLYPNTVGDWGCSNQWLGEHDYKSYDMFLFSHDDNFILGEDLFTDILPKASWFILTNSTGNTQRFLRRILHLPKPLNIRGSFEFFKKEMMDMLGGKFDLSETTLTREGKFTTSNDFTELSDWNTTVFPLINLIKRKKIQKYVKALSVYYRMSKYCLEGERGYIFKTEKSNTKEEEKGLDMIEKLYKKKLS
jgi:hypothetical protein